MTDTPTPPAEATDGRLPARNCSVLFIGGLADGQRRPDPESQYWKVAGAAPVPCADHDFSKPFEYVRNEALYRRERLRSGREEWVIYVLDSLTTEQAMGKLVRGYPSQNVQGDGRRDSAPPSQPTSSPFHPPTCSMPNLDAENKSQNLRK